MESIDYKYIFENLDTMLNLPLQRKGKRWNMPSRINLERHKRRDKTVFYINKAGTITVTEQGGESMSLFDFLVEFVPECHNARDAYMMLTNYGGCKLSIKDYYENKYDKKVSPKYVDIKYCDRISDINHWSVNNLFTYLCGVFGKDNVIRSFSIYKVGCLGKETVIFWYSDKYGNICHDNRIRYADNGHRKKETHAFRKFTTGEGFVNKGSFSPILKDVGMIGGAGAVRCMVESEKTALIASMMFNEGIVWTACGGMNQLGGVLSKNILLFPDYDDKAIELWSNKGKVIKWWEYPELSVCLQHNDDIGDAIIRNKRSINIKKFMEWIK